MEKELKKAKFRLLSLLDEGMFREYATRMHGDFSAHMRFAFMQLYMPCVRVYVRQTEHFLLLILHRVDKDTVACLPPLGDWNTYSIKRPLESYRSFFKAIAAPFTMVNVSEWMLPLLRENGLEDLQVENDAEEGDCLFMAQDYALSLQRGQTKQELEKLQATQAPEWLAYSALTRAEFEKDIRAVYDSRLKKADKEKVYAQLFSLIEPLDIKLYMLRGKSGLLGLIGYRVTAEEMEILLYHVPARPKGVEAAARKQLCQGLDAKTHRILISGAYYDKSLICGKLAEVNSRQLFNYTLKEK